MTGLGLFPVRREAFEYKNQMILKRIFIAFLGFIIYIPIHIAGCIFRFIRFGCGLALSSYGLPNLIIETIGLLFVGLICGKTHAATEKPFLTGLIYNPVIPLFILVPKNKAMELPLATLFIPLIAFTLSCAIALKLKKQVEPNIGADG